MRPALKRLSCHLVALLLVLEPLLAQASNAVRERVRELHSKGSEVQVSLTDGTSVRGQIIRVEPDSFTLRLDPAQETVFPFAKVADVRKRGGGPSKALWIPLVIGGGVLLALCVLPYPMGLLCRSDPS